jgi:ubiquinone/menaquinone biosynthesis C-methylase UbiE
VELHPLARQFALVADASERGRPEHAPAVIGATAQLGIGPGDPVVDLAAGTGKLTRALVAYGFAVVAVEPREALRADLSDKVAAAPVLDGVTEQIPLGDRSVAAGMIADAFHWFDRPRVLVEIRRVLAPGGRAGAAETPSRLERRERGGRAAYDCRAAAS